MHRREQLTTRPTPDARHDYLVELAGEPVAGTILTIRLVPDRLIADPQGFIAYLDALAPLAGNGLERLALAVLDDVNNELVPRWVEVSVHRTTPFTHNVVVEDRQPNWDNPALLARLRTV